VATPALLRELLNRLEKDADAGGRLTTRLWNELEPRFEELSQEEQLRATAAVVRARTRRRRAQGRVQPKQARNEAGHGTPDGSRTR
jgi:hypothetical protein